MSIELHLGAMVTTPHRNNRHRSKSRPPATFIGATKDIDGQGWTVRERRPTLHGFDVELGWPDDDLPEPGNVPGGPSVILTAPLAEYLRATMSSPKTVDLPISRKVVRQLARRAGVPDFRTLRAQWWVERHGDLCTLPTAEFQARHGMSKSHVDGMRQRDQGARRQATGWYRAPQIAHIILTRPQHESAVIFGVTVQAISMARVRLRQGTK